MIPQAIRVDYEAGESVGSFGERLRREREMRGVSLEQIVATTKIGRRLLLALEEEQFDLLPGGIFNKSYVKAYAKCVGIDEDEAVAEYMKAANETPPDTRVIAQQHASIHSNRPMQRAGFPVLPVLILVVVIAGGIGGWKVYQDRQNDKAKRAAMPRESGRVPTAGECACLRSPGQRRWICTRPNFLGAAEPEDRGRGRAHIVYRRRCRAASSNSGDDEGIPGELCRNSTRRISV